MQPGGHIAGTDHIAVDDGEVVLLVPVVPEGDHPEVAEPAGQLGHRDDAHAHPVRAETRALVLAIALHQCIQLDVQGAHALSFMDSASRVPDSHAAWRPPPAANTSPASPRVWPWAKVTWTGPASSQDRSTRAWRQRCG